MRFEDQDWEILLRRINAGDCTPFLGAAVNEGILPLGKDIAEEWAQEFDYPLESKTDLAKVAQYLAIKNVDPTWPKEMVREKLDKSQKPFNFNEEHEPLNVLAKLPFPLYITTNYDDLLFKAIEYHGRASNRIPVFEMCNWNNSPRVKPTYLKRGSKFKVSVQTPMIYHLHGHKSVVDSLVLTEDDYLDFLVNMSKDFKGFLPAEIQEAITKPAVLFIGYSLADVDFKVLFRGLLSNLERALGGMSVAVQLPYGEPNKAKAEDYVTQYIGNIKPPPPVRVYWGTAKEFTEALWNKWKNFK